MLKIPKGFTQLKFVLDLLYTYLAFGILVLSGIVINLSIVYWRDIQALGIFNISFVSYMLAAQVATIGLQYSVLRKTALVISDSVTIGKIIGSAAVMCAFSTLLVVGTLIYGISCFKFQFQDPEIALSIKTSCLGILLFPLNKLLQAQFNGRGKMKLYSIIQIEKYSALMLSVILFTRSRLPIHWLPLGFLVAECTSFALALFFLSRERIMIHVRPAKDIMKELLQFGLNSFVFSILSENATKILLLFYSTFLSPLLLGMFSFIIMLVDGFLNAMIVIRTNYNPRLINALHINSQEALVRLLAHSKKYVTALAILLALFIFSFYAIFFTYVHKILFLKQGLWSLGLILISIVVVSRFLPFTNLFVASGRPRLQAIQQLTALSIGLLVGGLCIPSYGLLGAAVGMMCCYSTDILILLIFSRKYFHWNLFNNAFHGVG